MITNLEFNIFLLLPAAVDVRGQVKSLCTRKYLQSYLL